MVRETAPDSLLASFSTADVALEGHRMIPEAAAWHSTEWASGPAVQRKRAVALGRLDAAVRRLLRPSGSVGFRAFGERKLAQLEVGLAVASLGAEYKTLGAKMPPRRALLWWACSTPASLTPWPKRSGSVAIALARLVNK